MATEAAISNVETNCYLGLSLHVGITQFGLLALHRDGFAVDEDLFDVSAQLQRGSVGDDNVRGLAHVERAEFLAEAPDLSRIQRDGLEGLFFGKSVGDGVSGGVRK